MGGRFSRRNKEENVSSSTSTKNNNTASSDSEGNSLLLGWNIAAGATVLLPLLLFMVARLVTREGGEEGGGEEGEGWWSRWWGGNEGGEEGDYWWWQNREEAQPEDQGKGALTIVYLWSLILFAVLVWRGNHVLGNNKDTRALFGALVVFANLAFLCLILIAGLGVQREGEAAERGWLGQFPAVMVLTFLFWTIFGAVFASILYGRVRKTKSFWRSRNSGDYQKYEDEGGII